MLVMDAAIKVREGGWSVTHTHLHTHTHTHTQTHTHTHTHTHSAGYVLDGVPKTMNMSKEVFGQGEEINMAIMPGISYEAVYPPIHILD